MARGGCWTWRLRVKYGTRVPALRPGCRGTPAAHLAPVPRLRFSTQCPCRAGSGPHQGQRTKAILCAFPPGSPVSPAGPCCWVVLPAVPSSCSACPTPWMSQPSRQLGLPASLPGAKSSLVSAWMAPVSSITDGTAPSLLADITNCPDTTLHLLWSPSTLLLHLTFPGEVSTVNLCLGFGDMF